MEREAAVRHYLHSRRFGIATIAVVVGLLATTVSVGPAHADVVLDLGRGPVTVHVPPSYDPAQPAPLVVLLHGYGASGQLQENYMQLLPWTDRLGLLCVFPDGTVDPTGARFWNATDACCDFFGSGVDDSGYLRDLIEEIAAELSVDTERVFLLGHSNGGFMAYRMACDHADIIAAVASLAGATFVDPAHCSPSAPVRTLQIHGTADDTVEYDGGVNLVGNPATYPGAVETTERWAAYNQCSLVPDLSQPPIDLVVSAPGCETTVTRYADGCDPGGSSELWSIVGGGHIPNLSPDFVRLVLDFFLSGAHGSVLLTHRLIIPAAAYAAGAEGAFFQTDVDLSNAGESGAEYRFIWMPRGQNNNDALESELFTLGAGQSIRYQNVLAEVFDLEPDAFGALRIDASSIELHALARIANTPPQSGAGSFGQAVVSIGPCDCTERNDRRRLLFGTENADMRFNVGCLNASDKATRVRFELHRSDGTLLGTESLILMPWSNDQLNKIFDPYRPVTGYVDYWSDLPTGSVYCYGSVLDNVTSDPTTVPPM